MSFTIFQVIERALLLMEKSGRWIQGANARTTDGRICHWSDADARKFDLEGALRRAGADLHQLHYQTLLVSYREVIERDEDGEEIVATDAKGKTKRKWRRFDGPLLERIDPYRNPFDWNDEPGRTQDDVVRLLKDLAAHYRHIKEAA